MSKYRVCWALAVGVTLAGGGAVVHAAGPRQMENLGRGLVALNEGGGKVFISWRVLGTDPDELGFNLYRKVGAAAPVRLNTQPITGASNYVDTEAPLEQETAYVVRPILGGVEQEASRPFVLGANAPVRNYIEVALTAVQVPGVTTRYTANDCSIGDLDGDGEYEIVVHMTGQSRDTASSGMTDPPVFQAYKLDGTLLWTINLGRNIREGAHYTQFIVADLDGDGSAEVAMKTADGSIDGRGKIIGDANANWAGSNGKISTGPEFFTIFSGKTGEALATTNYVPGREPTNQWGGVGGNGGNDQGGNRNDRFLAGLAWLDGTLPSVIMCRGYYGRSVLAAWDWREGKLTSRWVFDSMDNPNQGRPYITRDATVSPAVGLNKITDNAGNWLGVQVGDWLCWDQDGLREYRQVRAIDGKVVTVDENMTAGANKGLWVAGYSGMGAHSLSVADVDGDGRDDIVYHAMTVSADGKGLYTTGLRHGDALHVGRFDPTREGLQVFTIHENEGSAFDRWTPASSLHDARTGKVIWRQGDGGDAGRGLAADIDPRYPGAEMWSNGSTLRDAKGNEIGRAPSSCNFAIWWDGDELRELLDGNSVRKWDYENSREVPIMTAQGCASNNGSKSTPGLLADLLGDWREEVVFRTTDGRALRIYSTTIPTQRRMYTLMHDAQYRTAVAWQNVAYNQPPHPGFHIGPGMKDPPRPSIVLVKAR